uniref:Macaca fascicularis brain cDNA, clone: QflA-19384 n=1 Tax=Macaca fascicularis TaxID=9541 RepID=I7G682_MACFA|nr:unnamed protein product [Macaca fascicularis]
MALSQSLILHVSWFYPIQHGCEILKVRTLALFTYVSPKWLARERAQSRCSVLMREENSDTPGSILSYYGGHEMLPPPQAD